MNVVLYRILPKIISDFIVDSIVMNDNRNIIFVIHTVITTSLTDERICTVAVSNSPGGSTVLYEIHSFTCI